MRLGCELRDELIAHARAEAPNECCGLIGVRDGELASYYPVRNAYASPTRFLLHSDDLPGVNRRAEDRGEVPTVVFHSHPRSAAYPSETDVNLARGMEEWFPGGWVICSLAGEEPVVRGFEIRDGAVREIDLGSE